MGDKAEIKGRPLLHIKGNYTVNLLKNLKIEIIRNGKVIKEFDSSASLTINPERPQGVPSGVEGPSRRIEFNNEGVFDLAYQDDFPEALHKKNYYRLIFFADNTITLITNPIFVEIGNGH